MARELLILLGHAPKKPCKKSGLAPDLEVADMLVEVKTGTYFTGGTACEKIPGVAFKYANAPKLYSKPLLIWCLGDAERYWRDMCSNESDGRQYLIGVYKEMGITFRTATDIMREIIDKDEIDAPPPLPKKKCSIVKRDTLLPTPLE